MTRNSTQTLYLRNIYHHDSSWCSPVQERNLESCLTKRSWTLDSFCWAPVYEPLWWVYIHSHVVLAQILPWKPFWFEVMLTITCLSNVLRTDKMHQPRWWCNYFMDWIALAPGEILLLGWNPTKKLYLINKKHLIGQTSKALTTFYQPHINFDNNICPMKIVWHAKRLKELRY